MLLTADGSKIVYQVTGAGSPLIFLHGNSQNKHYFKKQIDFFKRDYQLFLIDSRDHGKSLNSQVELTFDQLVTDIAELMVVEQLEQASIIGFSDGANIALTFAAKYPEKVQQLILASPNLTVKGLKKTQYLKSKLGVWTSHLLNQVKLKRVLKLAITNLPITSAELETITCPVLIIGGSHDIINRKHFIKLAHMLKNPQVLIAQKTGHSVPRLKAKWFNQTVFDFLKQTKN